MSGVNPVVLIQMLLQYHNYKDEGKRTFKFSRNNLMRIHTETDEEEKSRKSRLSNRTCRAAESAIRKQLIDRLHNKLGDKKIFISPEMLKIAVPLTSTGHSGFGMLTTGSRKQIPEGRFVRAFTYWEKVNDIDLSCFALTEDGQQKEFSWRNMYAQQGMDICFSGDETSGYNGGAEYFDIDIELFKANHPNFRYLIFCDNIYTGGGSVHFKDCHATGGYMIREKMEPNTINRWDNDEHKKIFLPKTVETSFKVTSDSSFCYMFAIDLKTREMVWLDIAREGNHAVAGEEKMAWLLDYLTITDVFDVWTLFNIMSAENRTWDPSRADILVTDTDYSKTLKEGAEVIHSWDSEKIFQYLQAG
jgi:hypothetical protein